MAEEQRTNEKRCTECSSVSVEYQGLSQAPGIGDKISKTREHLFKCHNCGSIFWYLGEHP